MVSHKDCHGMNDTTITRTWMIIQLKRGLTLEQIALDRGVSVGRVCRAIDHFQLKAPRRRLFRGLGRLAS